jgi:DNA invertase Pin-like site-specific DNA recombinase
MLVGYAPVSTAVGSRTTDPRRDAVVEAGVDDELLHEGMESGQRDDRSGLSDCLNPLRDGDTPGVWKLDRLRR